MKRRASTSISKYRRPKKRTMRYGGVTHELFPQYHGWAPRNFLKGERKYLDTTINTEADSTGASLLLNGMGLGNTASTRVGQQILITSLEIRLQLKHDQATDGGCRIMVMVDKQANGVAFGVTDVLASAHPSALRNLGNRKRFRCYLDRVIHVGSSAFYEGYRNMFKFIRFKRGLIVDYNTGNAGTIADIARNALNLVIVSQLANPAGVPVTGYCRIRYTDK